MSTRFPLAPTSRRPHPSDDDAQHGELRRAPVEQQIRHGFTAAMVYFMQSVLAPKKKGANVKMKMIKRGERRTQNVSYIFQGVFEEGLEHVSLHFEGILKTLPQKRHLKKCILHYLTFWYGPTS